MNTLKYNRPVTLIIGLLMFSATAQGSRWEATLSPPKNPLTFNDQSIATNLVARQITGDVGTSIIGQSFRIAKNSIIDSITVRLSAPLTIGSGTHRLQLALLKDSDGNGKGDETIGEITYYDLSNSHIEKNQYLRLELKEPIKIEAAYGHHFELFWTTPNTAHALSLWCSSNETEAQRGTYPGGHLLEQLQSRQFPSGENMQPVNGQDLTFYITAPSTATTLPEKTVAAITPPPVSPPPPKQTDEPIAEPQQTTIAAPEKIESPEETNEPPSPPVSPQDNPERSFIHSVIIPAILLIIFLLMMLKKSYEPKKPEETEFY